MSVTVLIVFKTNLDKGELYAQTLAFLGLIVAQWANAFNVNYEYKSWVYNFVRPNKLLMGAIGVSILLQLAVFMTPFGSFLHVTSVDVRDALFAIILPAAGVLLAVDLHKFVWHIIAKRRTHSV